MKTQITLTNRTINVLESKETIKELIEAEAMFIDVDWLEYYHNDAEGGLVYKIKTISINVSHIVMFEEI
jgi:hypothetical protein